MKSFENTLNKKYFFSSCEICDAMCCDGKSGTLFSQLVLEEFETVFKNFPIAFLIGNLGYLKPVVLLTNGKNSCRYLENNKCSIYDKRPVVCSLYPLSAHLTNTVFIDLTCPAVGENGSLIANNGKASKEFEHPILEEYQEKYLKMHFHFEKFNKKENLEVLGKINGNTFYRFKKDFDDKYIKMHLESLVNFDKYFI